jgi:hypothetical protein
MNPYFGWALAVVMVAVGWQSYGWQGVLFAVTVVVFWLLLQFNRALRAMKNAAAAPVGRVDSAVMLNARLEAGMPMLKVLALTKSLGRKVAAEPETWAWADDGGSEVTVELHGGKVKRWQLNRPGDPVPPTSAP